MTGFVTARWLTCIHNEHGYYAKAIDNRSFVDIEALTATLNMVFFKQTRLEINAKLYLQYCEATKKTARKVPEALNKTQQ